VAASTLEAIKDDQSPHRTSAIGCHVIVMSPKRHNLVVKEEPE
jgi:hypothetical protein